GNADQVADANRTGAEQVRLNSQHVAVTAGIVEDRFGPDLLLHQQAKRLVAHAGRGARAVRNVDAIHANRFQKFRSLDLPGRIGAPGWNDLHHGDELAVGDLAPHLRTFPERRYLDRLGLGRGTGLAPAGSAGHSAQEGFHDMDVIRRCAAATTYQAHTDVDKTSRVF